jgi:hypothetical protein
MIVRDYDDLVESGKQALCTVCRQPVDADELLVDGDMTPMTECCDVPAYVIDRDTPTLVEAHGPAWASFDAVPRAFTADKTLGLTITTKWVAAILVSRYDRYDEVYPKQKTIAAEAGIGVKAVGLALAHLENRGLIIRTRTHDRDGRRGADLIDLDPLVAAINRLEVTSTSRPRGHIDALAQIEPKGAQIEHLDVDVTVPICRSRAAEATEHKLEAGKQLEAVEVDEASLRDDEKRDPDRIGLDSKPLSPSEPEPEWKPTEMDRRCLDLGRRS